MDELVHHCVRELSFDGDLGCNVSRLRDFISEFHSNDPAHPQTVDDAYCSFLWSVIVQHPSVRIGTVPLGDTTEVYIAPQTSAKRKAKERGEEHEESAPATTLDVIEEAKLQSLADLQEQYGDSLRIAVDPETSFAAITGSHIRPSKLSPMVYTALQFITRGRENGISVMDLGKKSKYDQKTCHYLVNQLLDLDLVVKIRRGGVGSHFCIHKYFFERSPLWRQIREEEQQGKKGEKDLQQEQTALDDDGESQISGPNQVQFDPIDARHLSSLPLVKARIIKLLKSCKNNMHVSQNLVLKIGFSNPTKTDRRFFNTRLNDLIAQGIIEKLYVPNPNSRLKRKSWVQCIRLLVRDKSAAGEVQGATHQIPEDANSEIDVEDPYNDDDSTGLKLNLTLHRQMIDLLEGAGTRGMTLNELSDNLGNFDKRTIELLMTRLEKYPPPAHIGDLGIAELMETHGRERRHRYYTLAAYRALVSQENLHDSTSRYSQLDFSSVGDFQQFDASLFYDDEATLLWHQDQVNVQKQGKSTGFGKSKGRSKKSAPKESASGNGAEGRKPLKRKRDSDDVDATADVQENSMTIDAPPPKKKGRPPKKPRLDRIVDLVSANSAVETSSAVDIQATPQPKKRGRPPKAKSDQVVSLDSANFANGGGPAVDLSQATPLPKKRGRPPKARKETLAEGADAPTNSADTLPAPRKRGRPPKQGAQASPKGKAAASDEGTSATGAGGPMSTFLPQVLDASGPGDVEAPTPTQLYTAFDESANTALEDLLTSNFNLDLMVNGLERDTHPAGLHTATWSIEGSPLTELSEDSGESSKLGTVSRDASTASPHHGTTPLMSVRSSEGSASIPIDPMLMQEELNQSTSASQVVSATQMAADVLHPVPSQLSAVVSGEKRNISEFGADEGPAKRRKASVPDDSSSRRPKANVSQLRRENEIYQLLQQLGGIALTSGKDFLDAHMALIQKLVDAGEPTSAPVGSRLDRRTIEATLNSLESRGKVKTLKTVVKLPTGSNRPARITYLPMVAQQKIHAFCSDLGRTLLNIQPPSIKRVDEEIPFLPGKDIEHAALPLRFLRLDKPSDKDDERWSRNLDRADQLFSYDDGTIRNMLLTETHTRAQLYGFKVGKITRARVFHTWMIGRFAAGEDSPRIVSLEDRIVHLSYFFNDLPVQTYFSIVSALAYDERLSDLLNSDSGSLTPVGDIDQGLHSVLQVGRARARGRILDLLEMLQDLELVVPLEPSNSETAYIRCAPKVNYPSAFSIASLQGWTPQHAPMFWRFHNQAPIRLWAIANQSPPLWREVPLVSETDGIFYWRELQRVSTDGDYARDLMCPDKDHSQDSKTPPVARSIRRKTAWTDSYVLTWHQSQYLKRFINAATGQTPLDEIDGSGTLQRVSWVVGASSDVVRQFFETEKSKRVMELEAAQKKARRKVEEEKARQNAEAKALLAQKAAEAKARREQEWEELVRRVHSESFPESAARRLRFIRSRFLQAGSGIDNQKWEEDVARAIRDARIATEKILLAKPPRLDPPSPPPPPPIPAPAPQRVLPTNPPPIIANAPEESVAGLIARQAFLVRIKPEEEEKEKQSRSKSKNKRGRSGRNEEAFEDQKRQRRSRFIWGKEWDELARDTSVIIRARCRGARIDWAAFDQVFPLVPRNSVRQRVAHLKEAPGADIYLQRLEEHWYNLWIQYRGSVFLPDNDPITPSNFDLVKHVDFLRRHIDKNAIRVGFEQASQVQSTTLPESVEELQRVYETVEKSVTETAWDFVWNIHGEEHRCRNMARQAFVLNADDDYRTTDDCSETMHLAESALKIVLGTPNEVYDAEAASRMLHHIGEEPVSEATSNMLNRGIVSKLVRDPSKPKPGRTLKISDVNQNALGGSYSSEVFQDAVALEDIGYQQGGMWRDWPLLASDGDTAALLELVSENKVNFKIDTSLAQSFRPVIDWNSKKADDDQIETAISIQFHDVDSPASERPAAREASTQETDECVDMAVEHGKSFDGSGAACRVERSDAVDCHGCITGQLTRLKAESAPEQASIIDQVTRVLHEAGPTGISGDDLLAHPTLKNNKPEVSDAIHVLSDAPVPLLHRVGYSEIMLISSTHVRQWTVVVAESPLDRMFPRRWIDIFGTRVNEVWEAALRAVMGVIILRPGISQAEIRWRLRAVYDRQEVNDILRYLRQKEFLEPRVPLDIQTDEWTIAVPNNAQEKTVMWFPGTRPWYQV